MVERLLPKQNVEGSIPFARSNKARFLDRAGLGVTGFCWGGNTTNYLGATLGADMHAGVPFYGAAAETAAVPSNTVVQIV